VPRKNQIRSRENPRKTPKIGEFQLRPVHFEPDKMS